MPHTCPATHRRTLQSTSARQNFAVMERHHTSSRVQEVRGHTATSTSMIMRRIIFLTVIIPAAAATVMTGHPACIAARAHDHDRLAVAVWCLGKQHIQTLPNAHLYTWQQAQLRMRKDTSSFPRGDTLGVVFSFLSACELMRGQLFRVSKEWLHVLSESPHAWGLSLDLTWVTSRGHSMLPSTLPFAWHRVRVSRQITNPARS